MQREDDHVPRPPGAARNSGTRGPRASEAAGDVGEEACEDVRARVEHSEVVGEFDGVCSTRHVKIWERRRQTGETVRGAHDLGSVAEPMS